MNYCYDEKASARPVVKPRQENGIDEQNDDALFDELCSTPMAADIERHVPERPGEPDQNACHQRRKATLKSG